MRNNFGVTEPSALIELEFTATAGRILGWQQHNFAPKDFEVLCDNQAVKKVEGATYRNNWLTVDLPPTVC